MMMMMMQNQIRNTGMNLFCIFIWACV